MTCPSCTALAEQNQKFREALRQMTGTHGEPCQSMRVGFQRCDALRFAKETLAMPLLPSTDLQRAMDSTIEAAKELGAWFTRIKERQNRLLITGQSLESAEDNWDDATLDNGASFEKLLACLSDLAKVEGSPKT